MELLIGCGEARDKRVIYPGRPKEWTQLVTLDWFAGHKPDIVWDMNAMPWPLENDTFDEVHGYEVLEHMGSLGDECAFFGHFYEIWRVLKPGGHLCVTVPNWKGMWAFGDPGHRRIINDGSLVFLDQTEYVKQVDTPATRTPMSDYRFIWKGDFERVGQQYREEQFLFVLEAHKPARLPERFLS